MVKARVSNQVTRVTAGSYNKETTVSTTNNPSQYWAQVAEAYATKMDGMVANTDYSAKYYATKAKEGQDSVLQNVAIVENVANTSIENMNAVRTEAIATIEEAVANIDNHISAGVAEISNAVTEGTEELETATTTATSNISMLGASVTDSVQQGIAQLGNATQQALTSLTDASNELIQEINATGIDGKVDLDGSNYPGSGLEQIISETSSNINDKITNCLLEVPQRIKYTLEDGTLTIKAGSQVIVPYGLEYSRETEGSDVDYSMVTIEDGVASGFGENNYIELQPLDEVGNEVDMRFKIRTGDLDNMEQEQYILESWDDVMADTYGISLCIELDKTLSVQVQDGYLTSDYELQSNTDYWIKVKNQTGTLRLYISLDGNTNVAQFIDQERLQVNWNGANIYLGGRDYPFQGSIDFNDSFMKINGLDYWSYTAPSTEEFKSIVEDYPVGSTFINENFKVADRMVVDGKFFVWAELVGDIVREASSSSSVNERLMVINITANGTFNGMENTSGASDTTSTSQNYCHYNTTTNLITCKSSGVIKDIVVSFPIISSYSDTTYNVASIQQVFNGFGYIGSTIWVDKGVKGLIPNGRNEDGTLKNIEVTTNAISTKSYVPNNTASNVYFGISNDGVITLNGLRKYDEENNIIYNGTYIHTMVECGTADYNTSGITSFNLKQPFRAVDSNEFKSLVQDLIRYDSATSTLYIGV